MDWDLWFFYLINSLVGHWDFLDWLMMEASKPGNLTIPVCVCAGYWVWVKRWEAAMAGPFLAGTVGIGELLGTQLKDFIGRPRPCQILLNIQELIGCGGSLSMPSNHALNTATASMFLCILYPRFGLILMPLVGLVGLSRIYLAAHYASDILVGWLIGGVLGGIAAAGVRRWIVSNDHLKKKTG